MVRKQKILAVYERLDASLPQSIQFLDEQDPFRFLISVILSAQTTDKIVNSVVRDLFKKFPTSQMLAQANPDEVEAIIYPTGYYRMKAKNIIACAQVLGEKIPPDTMEELLKLPGVGRKTANCVLGDIHHKPAIIVDTHVKRVVYRLGLVDAKDPEGIEKELAVLLPSEHQYRFSMTVNLFGRTVCHAKNPCCEDCLLGDLCPSRDAFLKKHSKA